MASPATITRYLDESGWPYDFDPATSIWRTGFRGEANTFTVGVRLTEDWLYLEIWCYLNAPTHPTCAARLHRRLLELNRVLNLVQFSIDADGDVVLGVELPAGQVELEAFLVGLNLLAHVADDNYVELLNIARNPNYEPRPILDQEGGASGRNLDEDLDEEGGPRGGGAGWELN